MATGGPQGIPGVTLHEAYRFETTGEEDKLEGFVFKAMPRRRNWEAFIEGTEVTVKGETRREAVELAIAIARKG